MSRSKHLLSIAATLLVGALVAWAGSSGGSEVGALPVFAICAAVSFLVNWIVYVPSFMNRTEHFFDLTGSITYVSLIAVSLALSDNLGLRSFVVAALVAAWAMRLGSFLFARIRRDGRDGRFDELKVDWAAFLMVWTLQGLWVLFTSAAALIAITSGSDEPFGIAGIIGLVVWMIGFAIEVTADRQKSAFKADSANDGRFITSGLWAWSRHPNYFGEITLWLGIAIIALPTMSGWRFVGLISPVFVYLLLTRISGLPLLESRASKRWGNEPAYQAYKARTPVLMMRPPQTA